MNEYEVYGTQAARHKYRTLGQMDDARAKAGTEFLSWLKRFEPRLYSHVMATVGDPPNQGIWAFGVNNLGQLGQNGYVPTNTNGTDDGGFMDWVNKAFETAEKAIPAYFQYRTQADIMEMNIARAQQGLPPIDPGVVAPQVKVIHDVPPQVQQEIQRFKFPIQIAMWGAIGIGAFILINALARR